MLPFRLDSIIDELHLVHFSKAALCTHIYMYIFFRHPHVFTRYTRQRSVYFKTGLPTIASIAHRRVASTSVLEHLVRIRLKLEVRWGGSSEAAKAPDKLFGFSASGDDLLPRTPAVRSVR